MESSKDIKTLLNLAEKMAAKHKNIVNKQMDDFLANKSVNKEDKDFLVLMNNKIEKGFKSGNADEIHSVITELTNKINK